MSGGRKRPDKMVLDATFLKIVNHLFRFCDNLKRDSEEELPGSLPLIRSDPDSFYA